MRRQFVLLACFSAALVFAQSPNTPSTHVPTEVLQAQTELEKLRTLVAMGAIPRARLDDAQYALEDAKDDAILKQTLFGSATAEQLTEQQGQDMIAAAQRRVDRQTERLAKAQKLVDLGIAARDSTKYLEEDLGLRQQALSLAKARAQLVVELAGMVKAEAAYLQQAKALSQPSSASAAEPLMIHYVGSNTFTDAQFVRLESDFAKQFSRPLPISAHGETETHRALGFDHRGRVDVALMPDQKEGIWLRRYLESAKIPYFAFRSAIAGKATGAHIHIGPPSTRLSALAD